MSTHPIRNLLAAGKAGATVASASTLAIGAPSAQHELIPVSGTTGVSYVAVTGRSPGQIVTLEFVAAVVVANNAGSVPAGAQAVLLAGGAFTSTAGSTLTLVNNGTVWKEIGRAVL